MEASATVQPRRECGLGSTPLLGRQGGGVRDVEDHLDLGRAAVHVLPPGAPAPREAEIDLGFRDDHRADAKIAHEKRGVRFSSIARIASFDSPERTAWTKRSMLRREASR